MLRLIEHLQSLHRDDLSGIALDLYTQLRDESSLKTDWRTHYFYLKVQNLNPDVQQFLAEWGKLEQVVFGIYAKPEK